VLYITPSERGALQLLARDQGPGDIAQCLCVSPAEVGRHLQTLFARIGASNRIEAIAIARRRGLLGVDDHPRASGARSQGLEAHA
jgi:DNA-binding CsgD family transcriptional regulator